MFIFIHFPASDLRARSSLTTRRHARKEIAATTKPEAAAAQKPGESGSEICPPKMVVAIIPGASPTMLPAR